MRIRLTARRIPLAGALHDLACRRAGFAFARFAPRVESLNLHLDDGDGPRNGPALTCRAQAALRGGTTLIVLTTGHREPGEAVATALDRLRDVVRRALERARVWR